MHIGYILKMYPRFSETFILNELLELERQNLDLSIFSLKKPDDGCFHPAVGRVHARAFYLPEVTPSSLGELLGAQFRIARNAPGAWTKTFLSVARRGWSSSWKYLLLAGWLADQAPASHVDHLHAHFASAATRVAQLTSRLTGISYSFTAHAKDIYQREADPALLRQKVAGAAFVVTVSDFNRDFLAELVGAEHATKIRRLYNGIDLSQFSPSHPDQRSSGLILGVGRLVEKKGFSRLIEACRLLALQGRTFECQIVGKGPEEQALRSQICASGLQDRVHLLGPKSQETVVALYRKATLFTLPCIVAEDGNRDALPTVLLEALACGLPVVSTPVTGIPEIVLDGETGLLVPSGDAVALAEAIARLFDDETLRFKLGQNGRRWAECEFDIHTNAARLLNWFRAIRAEQPLAAPSFTGQSA
jgi:glycosyltransferase involved in cell wall biosynthesis